MKADHADQAALLTIVELDMQAKAADTRLRNLPEHEQLTTLNERRRTLADDATASATKAADSAVVMRRVEEDLATARTRLQRDRQRIDDGVVNDARSIGSLQDEIAHLTGRIDELEDKQLELMLAIEDDQKAVDAAKAARADIETQMRALLASRDVAAASINDDLAALAAQRQQLTETLPAELVALYEKAAIRGGGGASELTGGRCKGCGLTLDALALRAALDAPPDEVVRCAECGRILIR